MKYNGNIYQWIALLGLSISFSCSNNDDDPGSNSPAGVDNVWSIPVGSVFDGGPGKDGIPSIDNPKFITVSEAAPVMEEDDLVIGFKNGDDIRAYPHDILDQHEIVNDDVNGIKLALNYCPLTGTALGWNRTINGKTSTFGVSGLLFNNNLMPYDRETNSTWSQLLNASVNGSLRDQKAELMQVIEMPWSDWKVLYPNSQVLSRETGFSRSYGFYPYGGYRSTNDLLFPTSNSDNRIFGKERVLGLIVNQKSKVYPFDALPTSGAFDLIEDSFEGQDLIVVGNNSFMQAFSVNGIEGASSFQLTNASLPSLIEDDLGNIYDVFGEVVSGPNEGERLDILESYMGFFFAFPAFYGTPVIFGRE